ncbi:MAG: pentapeptide repeat-containing protein, partial [Bacteroidales bacterium]|nr:pentapeptide repeat-containing protein [Bacteroidales bacterium]
SNADFSGIRFVDCSFTGCNLSLVMLRMTVFQKIKFKDCKMLGLHFEQCNNFGLSFCFENCSLNMSSFYGLKIKNTVFSHTQLQETDFSESDLTDVLFDDCDLTKASFSNTSLVNADFRTAYNYSIDPEINKLKKAKFSLSGVTGLLSKYDIKIEGI